MTEKQATIAGLCALLFWSTSVALARSITEQIGPLTAGCCIYMLGSLLYGLVYYYRTHKFPYQHTYSKPYMYICGSLFVLYMLSMYTAIGLASDRSQLLEIGLINYFWPILTVLFSIPLLKASANAFIYLGAAIGLIGIMFVATQHTDISINHFIQNVLHNPFAYFSALLAAISWAMYSNLSRRLGSEEPNGAVIIFMFATGILLFLLRLLFNEQSNWNYTTSFEVLYMAFAATLGCVLWDIGVRKGDFQLVSTASYFTPLLSTVFACLYLSVVAGQKLWIGCLLIILGAYISKKSLAPCHLLSKGFKKLAPTLPKLRPFEPKNLD